MDIQNAEVLIRIPTGDGSVMVLRGKVKDLTLSTSRDVSPVYSIGCAEPHNFIAGKAITEFTLTGYADDTQLHETNPGVKIEKPCRWSDIAEELK